MLDVKQSNSFELVLYEDQLCAAFGHATGYAVQKSLLFFFENAVCGTASAKVMMMNNIPPSSKKLCL